MIFKFTICIPAYNRAYIIERPLKSLLAQTYKNFEVLVVDDGSSDNIEDVVMPYKDKLNLRYIKKDNGGKHTALNTGIKLANGELFLILDSDDELIPTALYQMNDIWDNYPNKDGICGVIGRCATKSKIIGRKFVHNKKLVSYVDFHYGKSGGHYGDCCECVRTDILKKYSWPENLQTKFVPESYVNDKIGLKFKLIVTENVLEIKEYQENGITLNINEYIKKNVVGCLFSAVSKVEEILPNANPDEMTFHSKLVIWSTYWELVFIDKNNQGQRVSHITILGVLGLFYYFLKKIAKFILRRK